MKTYKMNADHPIKIDLGYVGENEVSEVAFNFGSWVNRYGEGTVQLLVQRCGDGLPYPVVLDIDGTTAIWKVSNIDTAKVGAGEAQLMYVVDDTIKKSSIFVFSVVRSLDDAGDIPEPYESILEQIEQQAQDTAINATRAEESAISASESASVASANAIEAEESATSALADAESARTSAINALNSENNAQASATSAEGFKNQASGFATASANSESNARTYKDQALNFASQAEASEEKARQYAKTSFAVVFTDVGSGNIKITKVHGGE